MITDERTLLAVSCIEPVIVDGVAGLIDYGDTFAAVYFRRRAVRIEHGHMVCACDPVHVVVRPKASLATDGPWAHWLDYGAMRQLMM